MAIIDVPADFGFSKVSSFKLQRASNTLRSRYTGQGQTVVYPFAVWMFEGTLIEYDGVKAGRIRSFLAKLEGQRNTFRLKIPGYSRPTTGYNLDGIVKLGGSPRASTLVIQGLTASRAIVNEGDYFTVNDELKMVTQDGASSGAGEMTISFKPALRKAVSAGAVVTFVNPTLLARSPDDDVANWSVAPPIRQNANFSAVEAVEI